MTSTPSQSDKTRQKLLLQIVIGSAWVDGQLDDRETQYLTNLLQHHGQASDRDLQEIIGQPVPIQQTERWMAEYLLGTNETERQRALSAIAKLIIVDDQVTDQEHQLLDDYYDLMATIPALPDLSPVVKSVGQFVKQAAKAIGQFVSDAK
ncbi:MAG: TerB family tellurite resistance protein [Oculatellaceae cyanobacterium Prado106]|jgi:uncharacterized membrane protein YebE (DUF533 family)|nr:TerB family tellurite resistance protein [Oculatellaceae cyanobacterium Prado106]